MTAWSTMLAVVKEHYGPGFALRPVPVPEPPPGWVRIRVRAVGICGSDLPIFEGIRPVPLPLIPGHETVGEVEALGEGVEGWSVGERVAVDMVVACGRCRFCRMGRPTLCERLIELGIHTHGGFAEYMIAPASNLHRLPDTLSFEEGTAADPLASVYHGLRMLGPLDGATVAVFGVGAIGLYAIQMARHLGAWRILVVGRRETPLQHARALGADETISTQEEDPVEAIRARTEGKGATVVIEATGAPEVFPKAIEAAAPGARVLILGVFHEPTRFDAGLLVRKELQLWGSLCYTWDEYDYSLRLLAEGRIRPLVSHVFPLTEMESALALLRRREALKVVIRPVSESF